MYASPLFSRRSIRSYTGEAVSEETLAYILGAAHASPVGMAAFDSLHVTVVRDAAFLSALDAATAETLNRPGFHPLYGAPALIIVSSRFPGRPNDNSAYSNAAILANNMALACVEKGAGACLIWGAVRTLNKMPDLLERLRLPEGFIPCCALTVGVTAETYVPRETDRSRIRVEYLD